MRRVTYAWGIAGAVCTVVDSLRYCENNLISHGLKIDFDQIAFLASEIAKYGLIDPYLAKQSLVRI